MKRRRVGIVAGQFRSAHQRRSALLLRKLLGTIRMEPVTPEIGRPYYRALSDLDALAIVEKRPGLPRIGVRCSGASPLGGSEIGPAVHRDAFAGTTGRQ